MADWFRGLSAAQLFALAGCAAVMIWSIPGLIINPDFGIGEATTSVLVLGVDMNGWHAVSGFLIVVPVLLVLNRSELLPWVQVASAAALFGTAILAIATEYPLGGLLYFPNPVGDVILHILVGSLFAAGAYFGFRGLGEREG